MRELNLAAISLSKRAENNQINLVDSFVDIGALIPLMSVVESQVLFGRRGTGKTHVFSYLQKSKYALRKCAIMIDMRLIGSTGGIYSDTRLSVAERATRLLSDTLASMHEKILTFALENTESVDLSEIIPVLDEFIETSTEIVVDGKDTELEYNKGTQSNTSKSTAFKAGAGSDNGLSLQLGQTNSADTVDQDNFRRTVSGSSRLRVHFGSLGRSAQKLIKLLPGQELWIFLDEWSEVPLDLQPYLADLIKRTIFPIPGAAVKIAAIAQRTNFRIPPDEVGTIGFELGADVAPGFNLDEFLVFDNEAEEAKSFFKEVLYRHLRSVSNAEFDSKYSSSDKLISELFTQTNAFEEFVRAAEGVPRDAINILSKAAQKAKSNKISIPDIRIAARNWFQSGKQHSISSRPEAIRLLSWIIDEVIKHRKAKGFLVPVELDDELIEFLYDARILHITKEGISAQDIPGKRYNVLSIDYGCYVDLINTNNAPGGLFEAEFEEGQIGFVNVPQTDYRSIRRSILDIEEFYKSEDAITAQKVSQA